MAIDDAHWLHHNLIIISQATMAPSPFHADCPTCSAAGTHYMHNTVHMYSVISNFWSKPFWGEIGLQYCFFLWHQRMRAPSACLSPNILPHNGLQREGGAHCRISSRAMYMRVHIYVCTYVYIRRLNHLSSQLGISPRLGSYCCTST